MEEKTANAGAAPPHQPGDGCPAGSHPAGAGPGQPLTTAPVLSSTRSVTGMAAATLCVTVQKSSIQVVLPKGTIKSVS